MTSRLVIKWVAIKFPPSRARKGVVCPGGGDVEASIWLVHNFLRLCFHASWARHYGWCRVFSSVCSVISLPMHQASASGSCWFSLRKGAINTSGQIKNWLERNQGWNFVGTIFVKSGRAVSTFQLFYITLQICQTCQQVSQLISSSRYDGKLQVVQLFATLLP